MAKAQSLHAFYVYVLVCNEGCVFQSSAEGALFLAFVYLDFLILVRDP